MPIGAHRAGLYGAAGSGNTIPAAAANSLSFNGSSSYGATPAGIFNGETAVSIAFWFKAGRGPSGQTIAFELSDQVSTRSDAFVFTMDQAAGTDYIINGQAKVPGGWDTWQTASGQFDSTWRHFVGTIDRTVSAAANEARGYINGVESGTTRLNQIDSAGGYGNYALNMGRRAASGGSLYYDGLLHDILFFSSALTAQEVSDLYNDRADPGTLIHQYTLSEGSGGTAGDSVSSKDFTLTNVTWSSDVP